jgi:hypothetical protein
MHGDMNRQVGDKKEHGVRNVPRSCQLSQGYAYAETVERSGDGLCAAASLGPERTLHWRISRPGRYYIAANAKLGKLKAQAFRECSSSRLRCRIGGHMHSCNGITIRPDSHDRTRALRDHPPCHGARDLENSRDIDSKCGGEVSVVISCDESRTQDSSGIDKDIHRPEFLYDILHHRLDRCGVSNVRGRCDGRPAVSADLTRDLIHTLSVRIHEGDTRPVFRQATGDGLADSLGGAGHQACCTCHSGIMHVATSSCRTTEASMQVAFSASSSEAPRSCRRPALVPIAVAGTTQLAFCKVK